MALQQDFQNATDTVMGLVRQHQYKDSLPFIEKAIQIFFQIESLLNNQVVIVELIDSSGEPYKVPALGVFISLVDLALEIETQFPGNAIIDDYTRQFHLSAKAALG